MSNNNAVQGMSIQKKATNLFDYLKAMQKQNESIVLNYEDYAGDEWHKLISELPFDDTENIDFNYCDYVQNGDYGALEEKTYILKVHNPLLESCPEPPEKLRPWLLPGWDDYLEEQPVLQEKIAIKGTTPVQYRSFNSVFDSELMYKKWLAKRDVWRKRQLILSKTKNLFNELFVNRQNLLKADGELELLIANGMLRIKKQKQICHPILLKRVGIEFDTQKNDIYVKDVDSNSIFNIELFNDVEGIAQTVVQRADNENANNQYYPFDRNEARAFLERTIHELSPEGRYFASTQEAAEDDEAQYLLSWEPMFILRKRPSGMAKMIDRIKQRIEVTGKVPLHLQEILEPGRSNIVDVEVVDESIEEKLAAVGGESINILLPKEANREQLEIAKTISCNDAMVVQGPPGTGKTHTIANLLGNFLAEGKRVLVTSHTNKALKVLKDKVEPQLQPLCVSVLDDSKKDIERSVERIARFSEPASELQKKINEKQIERNDIIERLSDIRKTLYQIRNRQCNNIVLNGEAFSPIEAAKYLDSNRKLLQDIIPGTVLEYAALPLAFDELAELYSSNDQVSVEEEQQLACKLPELDAIWSKEEFTQCVNSLNENKNLVKQLAQVNGWTFILATRESVAIAVQGNSMVFPLQMKGQLLALRELLQNLPDFEPWQQVIIADGKSGAKKDSWCQLVAQINQAYMQYVAVQKLAFGKEVTFTNVQEAKKHFDDYCQLAESDGKIGFLQGLFNSSLKRAKELVFINDSQINSKDDAILVVEALKLNDLENICQVAWKQLFGSQVIDYRSVGVETAVKYANSITNLLNWYNGQYVGLLKQIEDAGIVVQKLDGRQELVSDLENLKASLKFTKVILPELLTVVIALIDCTVNYNSLRKYYNTLTAGDLTQADSCIKLAAAVDSSNIEAYADARNALVLLIAKYSLQGKRYNALQKINCYAPEWAQAIKLRRGIHGGNSVPENIVDAWKWKQLELIINRINNCDYNELQKQALVLAKDYHRVTADLAAAKAWYELQRRYNNNGVMRNALKGWVELVKKIGKGTGKNAEFYRREARKKLTECQNAVPVWIMSISKVLESIDPLTMQEPFDVVIVDEASQANLTSLAVTFLGKKLIVVGDDKQVSPLAVGIDLAPIKSKADLYISQWIPNPNLFEPKDSLYSIASVAYPTRMLLEHFRCVPEIIGFSNWLSYDGKIKPLREASSSKLLPAVINYRVDGKREAKKTNSTEARAIAALLQSCIEQPEYAGKTFGVISLLGKEQANCIQRELLKTISNIDYEERQIICGDSANFQGDERDVIFLSMVDSNEGDGVLNLRGDGAGDTYKKRYNVAASRAKDQLWVVNSLDEQNSLKDGDLRRLLLSYAKNPKNYKQVEEQIERNSESPFEEAVAKALVSRGFHIVQQWEVGAYRIDMVAVYKKRKIAIECDGELYHSGADKILEDMQRQTILERLGWTFIRIRGSEYYADPGNTINRVVAQLREYGIAEEDAMTVTPVERDTELLQRVKQRAGEIMAGAEPKAGSDTKNVVDTKTASSTMLTDDILAELKKFLDSKGVKYIDKRNEGGDFCVLGGSESAKVISEVKVKFNYAFEAIENNTKWRFIGAKKVLDKEVIDFLHSMDIKNIKYIDDGEKKGHLWIIGNKTLKSTIHKAEEKFDIKFTFKADGGKALQHKAGFYVECQKEGSKLWITSL